MRDNQKLGDSTTNKSGNSSYTAQMAKQGIQPQETWKLQSPVPTSSSEKIIPKLRFLGRSGDTPASGDGQFQNSCGQKNAPMFLGISCLKIRCFDLNSNGSGFLTTSCMYRKSRMFHFRKHNYKLYTLGWTNPRRNGATPLCQDSPKPSEVWEVSQVSQSLTSRCQAVAWFQLFLR